MNPQNSRIQGSTAHKKRFPTFITAALICSICVAILLNITFNQDSNIRFLSIESAKPNGAAGLAAILREQNINLIDVQEQSQLSQITAESTVVLTNPDLIEAEDRHTLMESGAQIILLAHQYGFTLPLWGFSAYTIKVSSDSSTPDSPSNTPDVINPLPLRSAQEDYLRQHSKGKKLTADCVFAPAVQAKTIAPVEYVFSNYELDPTETKNQTTCFPDQNSGSAGAALINLPEHPNIIAFAAPVIFTNTFLPYDGNAAFALNLLGRYQNLYWVENYQTPRAHSSVEIENNTSMFRWMQICAFAALLSAAWLVLYKARRFGKLVAEPMPVIVPSGESDFGRAKLYARSRDYAYLARVIRNHFLATHLKSELPASLQIETETASTIKAAAPADTDNMLRILEARSGKSRAALQDLLFTRKIRTKSDLVKLKAELNSLAKELK